MSSRKNFWNVGAINSLRLRGAWGKAGRQPDTFAGVNTFGVIPGMGGGAALNPTSVGNTEVGPEKGTEIAYFGLMPRFIGQGLGGWLLRKAIARAWEGESRRIWLHTCTLDHPSALPNYLRHGFVATGTEEVPPPPK